MSKNPVLLKVRIWLVLSIMIEVGVSAAWAGQGYYLLTPPPLKGSKDLRDEQAPFRLWSQFAAYDTARECEESLSNWRIRLRDEAETKGVKNQPTRADWSRCIASDDHRLK